MRLLTTLAVALVIGLAATPPSWAAAGLYFSEYIEGSSNNKALEIWNGTGGSVDLSNYQIWMYFNGNPVATQLKQLTGVVGNHDVFVFANPSAVPEILNVADQVDGNSIWYNGDDAVALVRVSPDTAFIDVIGQIGFDPGSEWGAGDQSTADNTLRRKITVCFGDPDGSNAFDPTIEWDGFATNTFDGLGSHIPDCGPTAVEATTWGAVKSVFE